MHEIEKHGSAAQTTTVACTDACFTRVARPSILCLVTVGIRVPLLDGGTVVEACDSL